MDGYKEGEWVVTIPIGTTTDTVIVRALTCDVGTVGELYFMTQGDIIGNEQRGTPSQISIAFAPGRWLHVKRK